MGHLLSTKSSLVPLIDRLNRYPIGLVDNAKLREILDLLFDDLELPNLVRNQLKGATELKNVVFLNGAKAGHFAYIGDSENDSACFAAFRVTIGVANFKGRPTVPPRYVTQHAMGAGVTALDA